ncbi:MAG TPA: lysylphosphatidylglycerol synthase transmembrane domain-containing protein [Gemmatimonadales bacterium]|nr:lysylphosphatidylglycerol synthase transmembrane domain-containing protein [Gemmatimonadales bacterium]
MTPRRVAFGLLGFVLAAAMLLWALRGVHLEEVLRRIKDAHLVPVLLSVVLATLTFPIRLIRWRLLLRRDDGSTLPAGPVWHAVAIGFMANNILPFRAGELVRLLAITRLAGVRFSSALSSIAVERIFDGLAVVALLSAALLGSDLPAGVAVGGVPVAHLARVGGMMGLAALAGAGLVVAFPLAAERVLRRILPAGRLADRLVALIDGLRQGLAALRSPTLLAGVVIWSLVLWLVNAWAFHVAFAAFDIPVGFVGALLLQGILIFGISVQLTPGFVGQFEASIVAALALYAVPNDVASSYAITFHGTTFLPIILLGAWSLARTPVALRDLRRSQP